MNRSHTFAHRNWPGGLALALMICGCSRTGDLGTVLDGLPVVPGVEKPYAMPQLDEESAVEASPPDTESTSAGTLPSEPARPSDTLEAPENLPAEGSESGPPVQPAE